MPWILLISILCLYLVNLVCCKGFLYFFENCISSTLSMILCLWFHTIFFVSELLIHVYNHVCSPHPSSSTYTNNLSIDVVVVSYIAQTVSSQIVFNFMNTCMYFCRRNIVCLWKRVSFFYFVPFKNYDQDYFNLC